MTYIATTAVEGEQAIAQEFDTIAEAWWYLYNERCNAEYAYIENTGLCPLCGEKYSDDCDDDGEEAHDMGEHARKGTLGTVEGWAVSEDSIVVRYSVSEGVA